MISIFQHWSSMELVKKGRVLLVQSACGIYKQVSTQHLWQLGLNTILLFWIIFLVCSFLFFKPTGKFKFDFLVPKFWRKSMVYWNMQHKHVSVSWTHLFTLLDLVASANDYIFTFYLQENSWQFVDLCVLGKHVEQP